MIGSTPVRGVIVAICVCVAAAGCHRRLSASSGSLPDGIVNPYLAIHAALAQDSTDAIGSNAAALEGAAHAAGATPVETAARSLRGATTLADAREKFGALSETLVSYGSAHGGKLPAAVREAYCPMAKKPWLQRGSMISNPYYGKEMPTCGEFK